MDFAKIIPTFQKANSSSCQDRNVSSVVSAKFLLSVMLLNIGMMIYSGVSLVIARAKGCRLPPPGCVVRVCEKISQSDEKNLEEDEAEKPRVKASAEVFENSERESTPLHTAPRPQKSLCDKCKQNIEQWKIMLSCVDSLLFGFLIVLLTSSFFCMILFVGK